MDLWYFAYGSNFLSRQMIDRMGAAGHAAYPPRVARLENHRLVFVHLKEGGPAFANIVGPGEGVIGVLYRCASADLAKMDHFERGYERQPISVTDESGEVLMAVTYVVRPADAANLGKPSADYLAKIVEGAREHGLPESYISNIIDIAHA